MLTPWLQSTTHWGGGLRFVLVIKNRAYHEGIKCSLCEVMLGQPMKVGLKRSNILDDATEDVLTEEELEKVVFGEHGDKQNNLTDDPVEEIHVETRNWTSNDSVHNVEIEGPVFIDVEEETVTPIHRNGNRISPFSINVYQA